MQLGIGTYTYGWAIAANALNELNLIEKVKQFDVHVLQIAQRHITISKQQDAIAESDVVFLALPDVAIGKLSEDIIPMMKPGALVLTLDPAAPLDGKIFHCDDLGYVIAHPCHPSIFNRWPTEKAFCYFYGGISAKQSLTIHHSKKILCMKKNSLIFLLQFLLLQTFAQFTVSDNKHFILRDGKPFFWLGDTGWELFHRLNREQADQYLKRRAEQGFTVIQAVALAEFDGLHTPNPYGDLPLLNDDPATPNDKYFQHVDYIIDKAAEYNLVIGLLPTWGDKIFKGGWGQGPEVFTVANAKLYGKWLAERYKSRKNIIWILGGDRNPRNEADVNIWRSMAAGIKEALPNAMISFHPQPNETGSAEWFHKDDWLSFNMFQNGHCRNMPTYDRIQTAYNMQPTKPVVDGEVLYEDHPVCFNAKDLGTSNAYDIRVYAYMDLFAGAFGHTYGCHDIWQMYSPYREAVNGPHVYWQEAMELPGANQMKFVKRLILSRPFLERVPDQSLIVENNNAPAERIQATRGNGYAFIYSAMGKSFTSNLGKISGATLNAYWYNPRNGETKKIESVSNKAQQKFTPPTSGYGQDWILILDDASKNYKAPE